MTWWLVGYLVVAWLLSALTTDDYDEPNFVMLLWPLILMLGIFTAPFYGTLWCVKKVRSLIHR